MLADGRTTDGWLWYAWNVYGRDLKPSKNYHRSPHFDVKFPGRTVPQEFRMTLWAIAKSGRVLPGKKEKTFKESEGAAEVTVTCMTENNSALEAMVHIGGKSKPTEGEHHDFTQYKNTRPDGTLKFEIGGSSKCVVDVWMKPMPMDP